MFSNNGYLFLFFTEDICFAAIYDQCFIAVYSHCCIVMILTFFYLNGVNATAWYLILCCLSKKTGK